MFEAVEELVGEHADLETKLADPSVHSDQANARKLNKRYAELTPIVATYRTWKQTGDDIDTARRHIDKWRDAGYDYLVCGWPGAGDAQVEAFARDVMSAV